MMRHLSGRSDGYTTVNTRIFECFTLYLTYVGSALASTGDNGKVHLWKHSLNGDYIEFADTEPV